LVLKLFEIPEVHHETHHEQDYPGPEIQHLGNDLVGNVLLETHEFETVGVNVALVIGIVEAVSHLGAAAVDTCADQGLVVRYGRLAGVAHNFGELADVFHVGFESCHAIRYYLFHHYTLKVALFTSNDVRERQFYSYWNEHSQLPHQDFSSFIYSIHFHFQISR